MDAAIILILALFFCMKSYSSAPTLEQVMVQQVQEMQLPIGHNDDWYDDPNAFEEVAHGLNFYS